MTTPHFPGNLKTIIIILIAIATAFYSQGVSSLGVSSTIAVSYSSSSTTSSLTICGILAGQTIQSIQCYTTNNQTISVQPNASFESIAGGLGFFCGLRSGGFSLLCWNTADFRAKRIHFDPINSLTGLTVGNSQICAIQESTGIALCWRFPSPELGLRYRTVTSGGGFSCGIPLNNNISVVNCWGGNAIGDKIQTQFSKFRMLSLVAGLSHACGSLKNGTLICRGSNNAGGQLNVPSHSPFEFSSNLALGRNHSCVIKQMNGFVVCWGGGSRKSEFMNIVTKNVSFESIVAGLDFTCGLTTMNFSIFCWGPGWDSYSDSVRNVIPIGMVIPGPCVQSLCNKCGMYPNSKALCGGSGHICRLCEAELPIPAIIPPIPPPQVPSKGVKRGLILIFGTVGCVGAFAGICSILYCLWRGVVSGRRKVDTSVEPATERVNVDNIYGYPSRSPSIKYSSGTLRSQRSGASSKHLDKAEVFSLSDLVFATRSFSLDNKIGGGSFGMVYKGKLSDGREVAIKRGDTKLKTKKIDQEKDSAFESELALLSRLHHKHLVDLVGFCDEDDERLLVYEYMRNGSLHDHLHNRNSTSLNSWKTRIKIVLGAARGIEYLHNYAVPPIIHRDIKSSNILLDANLTAKVSDFGLSLMGPDAEQESMSAKAVGTVGYIDPEYYVLHILTAKSDVYGFGVVLLELLTGKRAVFKDKGIAPTSVVDYARPQIAKGELRSILDKRVELSEMNEEDAVELVAYTALQCVNLEGIERPNMADVVANLERAFGLCEGNASHGSISSVSHSGTSQ